MLIRLSDHELVDDLCRHFRRSGFTAEPVSGGMVEVTRIASNPQLGEREILMHLRVWNLLNRDAEAEAVG